ncbi:replicative DNA helicase [Trichlorobacter lovleyi]|uniref:DnaB domain protein n=1 Tax=Trichlorobacter lovleyi (strain ATCC BAA-1151 / DSM 17278 / SZ) TaxID=398767 RepID=B3E998_TRIL1|nr:DnaB-like helicase C-terminal domain-containing protein [Trichlorobacter lovleyi]ACD93764.1 DnaB domain protein [Trichlorobacter lovleyi SZ]
MQSFENQSAQNSLCKPVYRYSGQPIYAVHEFIDESLKMVQQSHEHAGAITGYPTGFLDLDHMLCGLQPGTLTVIASRPSNGKSSLAMNIAMNVGLKHTIPTAIFSLELSKEQLGIRLLSAVAHVDICRARTGHLSESDLCKLDDAKETLRKSAIYVDDTSGISITELLAKAIRLKVDHNVQVIIIDYLQLMRDDARSALDPTEISRISSSLKVLARELGVAVILLSQLHSSVGRRKAKKTRPKLSDLGNTGSLEDDADVILLIYRESVYCKACRRRDGSCVHNHEDLAEIIVAKHKNGPIGTVFVNFHADTLCFSNLC